SAAPGIVRVRVRGPRRRALGAGRPDPDLVPAGVIAMFRAIGHWFEERTGIGGILALPMEHRVPRQTASWAYVFGSATMVLFVLQIATRTFPSAGFVP